MEMTVHGETVFAATGGRAWVAGQPMVMFLHGAGMDHTVWALQTRYFAHHGYNVAAIDFPGHGRSSGAPLTSIAAMADWVAAAAEGCGAADLHLVGHSMGALVALELGGRTPTPVVAAALLGVAAEMPVHPKLLAAAEAGDHWAFEAIVDWGFAADAHVGGQAAPGTSVTGAGLRLLESGDPAALARDFSACDSYQAAPARAATMRAPCLVLTGARDKMAPASKARPLAEALVAGRLETLPATGHMMMVEAPDRTLDSLITFFDSVAAR